MYKNVNHEVLNASFPLITEIANTINNFIGNRTDAANFGKDEETKNTFIRLIVTALVVNFVAYETNNGHEPYEVLNYLNDEITNCIELSALPSKYKKRSLQ